MKTLLHVADMIFDQPHAILPEKLNQILHVLGPRLALDDVALEELSKLHVIGERPAIVIAQTPDMPPRDSQDEPYRMTPEGIAIIPMRGTLMKRGSFLSAASGCATYQGLAKSANEAMCDPMVKALLFDVDSPGGTTHGCFELSEALYSMRGDKPIWAIANDLAASAAYALASAADRLFITSTGGVGSVGVFAVHIDQSGLDQKTGVNYTYVSAGAKKTDGNPHEPLSKSAKADIQAEVDREYEMFVAAVARNRDLSQQTVRNTEAAVLFGSTAVGKLADEVSTFTDTLQMLTERISTAKSKMIAQPGIPDNNALNSVTALPHHDAMRESTVPAIAPHKTATSDKAWDGPQAKKNLRADESEAYYRKAYAFQKSDGDPKTKAGYSFIHHEVASDGTVGAANIKGCQSSIGVLNGGRGGTVLTGADRRGTYNHVAAHLRDAKLEPAPLASYQAYIQGVLEVALEQDNDELHALAVEYLLAGDPGESTEQEAAVAKKSEDQEPKKKDEAQDEKDAEREEEDDDVEDDDEDDDKKPESRKSRGRAGVTEIPMAANGAAKQIAELCKIAGAPELAADYISAGFTVNKVITKLSERRVAASEKPGTVGSFVTGEATGAQAQMSVEQAIRQARVLEAGSSGTLTRYRALERVLLENPTIYESYMDERDRVIVACPSGRGPALTEYVLNHQRRYMAQLGLSTAIEDVVRTRSM